MRPPLVAVLALGPLSPALGALSLTERVFYKVPSNHSARSHLWYITSEAHVAGTPGDLKMARYVHDQFRSYGLDSSIEPVPVLLNYPVTRSLELLDHAGLSDPHPPASASQASRASRR